MELRDFMASGIIESYLLGTATQQEVSMVHSMLKKYPSLKTEVEAVENILIEAAGSGQRELNKGVKDKIFSSIQFKTTSAPDFNQSGNLISIKSGRNNLYFRYALAASIGLLIVSTIMNILLFGRTKKLNNEMADLSKQNTLMQSEMQTQKTSLEKLNAQFAVLTDPSNKAIPLKGLDISPDSKAMVYWNNISSEVYLYVHQLPAPPTDMQYQLWAIVDGKPVDAGVFDTGESLRLQKMKLSTKPQAFAVTLEKKGGSPIPTMEAMYLIGEV